MPTHIPKIKFDYSNIAAKIYSRSFFAVCIFILISLALIWHKDENIKETLKLVLEFIYFDLWQRAYPYRPF